MDTLSFAEAQRPRKRETEKDRENMVRGDPSHLPRDLCALTILFPQSSNIFIALACSPASSPVKNPREPLRRREPWICMWYTANDRINAHSLLNASYLIDAQPQFLREQRIAARQWTS